jgi:hypothetical protein
VARLTRRAIMRLLFLNDHQNVSPLISSGKEQHPMERKELSHHARAIMVVILALLLAGCAANPGEVRGVFVNLDGEPLSETITVTLEPLSVFDDGSVGWSLEYQLTDEYRQRLQEVVTNDGRFIFENVEPGPYWVKGELPGRPINTSPAFEVAAGEVIDFGEIIVE